MLSFVSGSPGSGKTDHLINKAKKCLENNREALFIVPEQNALTTERKISTCFHQSRALLSLEVTSFRRLANIVFRQCGGLCYNYLEKGGQAVMMWRALSELSLELNSFKPGSSTDIGLVSSLVSLCDEFSDCCITPEKLGDAVEGLPLEMRDRVGDLSTVYTRYSELIHKGFDSPKDDLVKAAEMILSKDVFRNTDIYIDGFTGFTPAEYRVIEALISKCPSVTVSFSQRKDKDLEIFYNQLRTKKRLSDIAEKNNIDINEDLYLDSNKTKELSFFEHYAFDNTSTSTYEGELENITAVVASDIYRECELVAADIAKQIREGRRYRDLYVVMADRDAYASILDTVFKRHNIPCHFSIKEDILQKPVVKLLLCALNIIEYNWRLTDVISYMKTGLSGISEDECDILEEYASTWSISGALWKLESLWTMNPDGYKADKSGGRDRRLVRINEIRDRLREPIIELADSFGKDVTVDEAAKGVYSFLMTILEPKDFDDDFTAVWNALMTALEQLSSCAEGVKITDLESFKKLLKLLTSQTAYSLIPSTVDEVSCVSSIAYNADSVKKCYIIGAVDGVYPSAFKENLIINNEIRIELNKQNCMISDDPDERHYEDLWQFWNAMLSADEVWVSRYNSSLDGNEILPSPAFEELLRLYPGLKVLKDSDFDIYDMVYDEASAVDLISDPQYGEAIKGILSENEKFNPLIESLSVPIVTNECVISDPENLSNFEGDINLTQSRVDSFSNCKFGYALQYILKLNEQGKVTYEARDVGNFIHSLLEEFFTVMKNMSDKGEKMSRDQIEAVVDKIVETYIQRTCGNTESISKRLAALFSRLKRQGLLFVRSIYDEFENSDFKPVLFEVSITNNDNDSISPFRVELPDGSGVYIYGQIDRIDTFERDGKLYFRVVDYKTGKKEFSQKDLEKGINLQLFLYMFSIMENKKKFCEKLGCVGELVPAGVIYYMARLPDESYESLVDDEKTEAEVISKIKRQGMILNSDEVIRSMCGETNKNVLPADLLSTKSAKRDSALYSLESLEDIKATISNTLCDIGVALKKGIADAKPRDDCNYCRMRVICRHLKKGDESESEQEN